MEAAPKESIDCCCWLQCTPLLDQVGVMNPMWASHVFVASLTGVVPQIVEMNSALVQLASDNYQQFVTQQRGGNEGGSGGAGVHSFFSWQMKLIEKREVTPVCVIARPHISC